MVLYPSLEGMYGLQLNRVLAGHVTPEQAMEEAQVQFETILKQNFYLPYPMEGYNDTLEKTIGLIKTLSP
jgi:multiple sugar transport system substrate-binding protein